MTEKLRDLLHERAADVDFPTPDLDVLVRAGDRRVRRRRGLVAAGSLAALAVVAALVVPSLDSEDAAPDPAGGRATEALPVGVVSWAEGSVLHAGDVQVDLGFPVLAFVQTSGGYVVVDPDGAVSSLVDGVVTEIGHTAVRSAHLVSDHDSTLVGWVSDEGDVPAFVVHDLGSGSTVLEDSSATTADMGGFADEADPAYFYAIDGDTAYWRDGRGAVAVDVGTGDVEVIDAEARNGFDLIDVQDGTFVFYGEGGVTIGDSRASARPLRGVQESRGVLSPLATQYAPDAEEARVEGRNGTELQLFVPPEYSFSTVYEWADDETVRVVALEDEDASADLLSCVPSTGGCELLVDGAGTQGDLQLPVGVQLGS